MELAGLSRVAAHEESFVAVHIAFWTGIDHGAELSLGKLRHNAAFKVQLHVYLGDVDAAVAWGFGAYVVALHHIEVGLEVIAIDLALVIAHHIVAQVVTQLFGGHEIPNGQSFRIDEGQSRAILDFGDPAGHLLLILHRIHERLEGCSRRNAVFVLAAVALQREGGVAGDALLLVGHIELAVDIHHLRAQIQCSVYLAGFTLVGVLHLHGYLQLAAQRAPCDDVGAIFLDDVSHSFLVGGVFLQFFYGRVEFALEHVGFSLCQIAQHTGAQVLRTNDVLYLLHSVHIAVVGRGVAAVAGLHG